MTDTRSNKNKRREAALAKLKALPPVPSSALAESDLRDEEALEDPSGPFCKHWIPGGCDRVCDCGHVCESHLYGDCKQCDCEGFAFINDDWSTGIEDVD